jgi:glycosyltransferase involved in cell wall biosynthesis
MAERSSKILLSHPTGNPNVRGALKALSCAGMLDEFWTCVSGTSPFVRYLPRSLAASFNRRSFAYPTEALIHTRPWREIARQAAMRVRWDFLTTPDRRPLSHESVAAAFDRQVAKRIGTRPPGAVYAYDVGALHSFRAAKQVGAKRIYDLQTAHWRFVLQTFQEEAALLPDFAPLLRTSEQPEKQERQDEELALADLIIVPSRFVARSLKSAPGITAPIEVVPYGAPAVDRDAQQRPPRAENQKLKVLFVGRLTQEKGIAYLLDAVSPLRDHVELTLVGRRYGDCEKVDRAIREHRWIPHLSHDLLLQEMSQSDVLVHPTLIEGFALVIMEAMSRGLPVITTPNSGAEDLIANGRNGFLVPIRSAEAIFHSLEALIQDRSLLESMRCAAMETAQHCSWDRYGDRLLQALGQERGTGATQ